MSTRFISGTRFWVYYFIEAFLEKSDLIKYWLTSAQHDLEAAEAMFEKKKYDWCLFLGHLVLEKTLKAIYIRDNHKNEPLWTHNLVKLADSTTLRLSEGQRLFLLNVNDFHIEARYPDYKFKFYQLCTLEFTHNYFEKIKDFYQWLLQQIP